MEIVELMCPAAGVILHTFRVDSSKLYTRLCSGQPKGSIIDVEPTPMHQFHELSEILRTLIPQLHKVAHTRGREHIVLDEFIQGLVEIHRTNVVPMRMVVTCQSYLDKYDVLRDRIIQAADALRAALLNHENTTDDVIKFKETCPIGMSDVAHAFPELYRASGALSRFEQNRPETSQGKKHSTQGQDYTEVSAMEKAFPAHAGALLADLKVGMHQANTILANHGKYILSTVHLYKALRAKGVLKSIWHDMDDLVVGSFDGKSPRFPKIKSGYDSTEACRRFHTNLGSPPTGLPPKDDRRRKSALKVMEESVRKIHVTSPLLQNLSCKSNKLQLNNMFSKSKNIEIALHTLTASIPAAEPGSNASSKSRAMEAFTPLRLLATYKKSMMADEPTLNFDFTRFMMDCEWLLTTVFEAVHVPGNPLVPTQKAWDYIGMVKEVMVELDTNPEGSKVATAAAILESHINNAGNKFSKQAFAQSSGRIPKDARPTIAPSTAESIEERATMSKLLDHAGAGYAFSSRTMAVYHPSVVLEKCDPPCGNIYPPCNNVPNAATDPTAHHLGPRVVRFGTAVPASILETAYEKGLVVANLQTVQSQLATEYVDHLRENPHGPMAQLEVAKPQRNWNKVLEVYQEHVPRPGRR
ncbi:hypothetical protein LTR09_001455 [Extremus antarcticus]|uniref:Uncharacterized protein n=1 Tax=Extremus antarcticus TaxID=702011 RepID=A0AAJ0GIS6_9PEZI|nr:hypothetical protein LTR09_001455 [Extremus antarcticus]